jgi:hypothetical protein
MLISFNVLAEDDHKTHSNSAGGHVEEKLKEGKSSRRKKVEMCHDCGKPEVQCDCPEEVRKKEQEAKKSK